MSSSESVVIYHNPARGCAGQAKWFSTFSIDCRRDRFAKKTANR